MRRFVGVLAAVGLAVAGLAAAPLAAAGQVTTEHAADPGPLDWGPCGDPVLKGVGAQCAMLTVPLDYNDPTGPTIKLALSEVVHTSPAAQYQGVMLVNPGGPGGSGLELSTLGQYVPNGVGGDYDWIGFDPRGVGASQPALSCDPHYLGPNRPDYVPLTAAQQQTWLNRSKGYAQACGAANLPLLRHMSTVDSAHDLDSIRAALGVAQISYYGFSYGTYLGQVYGTLYPQRVKRLVLDSNVDPGNVWFQANLSQDPAFDRNLDIWLGWVANNDNVFHLGNVQQYVRQLFYSTQAALEGHPAGGMIGPDEWTDLFQQAAYYRFSWVDLATAFANWVRNQDASGLINLYQQTDTPGDDNALAVYLAVECTDAPWPTSWTTWSFANWQTYVRAPFATWGNAWFNAPCLYWPAPPSTPVTINGGAVPGALLIDETLDAATPYAGSLAVRQLFPNASLIAEPGGATHADSLFGDQCVDDRIADYLATGALPARQPGDQADTTCAPLPDPDPTQSSANKGANKAGNKTTSASGTKGSLGMQSAPNPAPIATHSAPPIARLARLLELPVA